jgi:hypothetical protein
MNKNAKRFKWLLQLALVCLVCVGVAEALQFANAASWHLSGAVVNAHRNGARFVFADLDGDQKPDLALVEMQSQRSAKSNYSIHVKLSAGAESAIAVNAPMGGLRVAARDVNGDDNLDLIVTSNLDGHFIEVLLNDGRGNFSQAAPGDFPQLEKECDVVLSSPAGPQADRATLASVRSSLDEGVVQSCDFEQLSSSDFWARATVRPALLRAALSHNGRSPPFQVALS